MVEKKKRDYGLRMRKACYENHIELVLSFKIPTEEKELMAITIFLNKTQKL